VPAAAQLVVSHHLEGSVELKEFVSLALQQVMSGVSEAQAAAPAGEINPKIWSPQRDALAKMRIVESNNGKWIHLVEFDVAVTVAEGTGTKGGLGLVVGPIALGSSGQSTSQNSMVSRIKFEVPVAWPEKGQ
jgi:hypothetical protein